HALDHFAELFLGEGSEVRPVVNEPNAVSADPQVLRVHVSADDAEAAALLEEAHEALTVTADVGLRRLVRVGQDRVRAVFTELEDRVEALCVRPPSDEAAQEVLPRPRVARLPVVEELEHAGPVGERHAFRADTEELELRRPEDALYL